MSKVRTRVIMSFIEMNSPKKIVELMKKNVCVILQPEIDIRTNYNSEVGFYDVLADCDRKMEEWLRGYACAVKDNFMTK